MNIFKLLVISTVSAIFCFSVYSWLQKPKSSTPEVPTLIVGTCDDYPPYTFQKDGSLIGLDIDLATLIANHLNKKIEFKNISFNLLLLELARGTIHVVAAGISPTI